jgi:hypothetical protein
VGARWRAPLGQDADAAEVPIYATSSVRRFVRLLTRRGFRVGNATRDNLAAVLDEFPIPATFFAIGHNAEFNVLYALLGPSARNEYQGESGHYPLRRTQGTEKHAGPALCPEEEYRPPYPSARRGVGDVAGLSSLPPPALRKRGHRGVTGRRIPVGGGAVFVMPERQSP